LLHITFNELQIKLQLIEGYSTENLKKVFYTDQVLSKYKRANNKKKSLIKLHIQDTFYQALKHQMIQDNCQMKFKNKKTQSIQILNITPLLIGQSEKIYFYEKLF
jgi:hypothetical protein